MARHPDSAENREQDSADDRRAGKICCDPVPLHDRPIPGGSSRKPPEQSERHEGEEGSRRQPDPAGKAQAGDRRAAATGSGSEGQWTFAIHAGEASNLVLRFDSAVP
jgi:hypothetical protein